MMMSENGSSKARMYQMYQKDQLTNGAQCSALVELGASIVTARANDGAH